MIFNQSQKRIFGFALSVALLAQIGLVSRVQALDLKAQAKTAGATVKDVLYLPIRTLKTFLDHRIGAEELLLGDYRLAMKHMMDWDPTTGFQDSTGMFDPITAQLGWGFADSLGLINAKMQATYDQFANITKEQMCVFQYIICIANAAKRRIHFGKLPIYFNRLNMKAEKTEGGLSEHGPGKYYSQMPPLLREKLFDKVIRPSVYVADIAPNEEYFKSKVSKELFKIAAQARVPKKFSERNALHKKFIEVLEKQGKDFLQTDKDNLLYWLKVHAAEFAHKTHQEDREKLKPEVAELLSKCKEGMQKAGMTVQAGEIDTVSKAVETDKVDRKWLALRFPESMSKAKKQMDGEGYLTFRYQVFKREKDPNYLSLYPFAGMGFWETTRAIMAIFSQHDRDVIQASESYRSTEEGRGQWRAVEKAHQELSEVQKKAAKARAYASKNRGSEQGEGLVEQYKDKLVELNERLTEVTQEFEAEAAEFPFVTMDEELEAALEGRETEEKSANERMYSKLAELSVISRFFDKAYMKKAMLLDLMGLKFDETQQMILEKKTELLERIAEGSEELDSKFMKQFLPETEEEAEEEEMAEEGMEDFDLGLGDEEEDLDLGLGGEGEGDLDLGLEGDEAEQDLDLGMEEEPEAEVTPAQPAARKPVAQEDELDLGMDMGTDEDEDLFADEEEDVSEEEDIFAEAPAREPYPAYTPRYEEEAPVRKVADAPRRAAYQVEEPEEDILEEDEPGEWDEW